MTTKKAKRFLKISLWKDRKSGKTRFAMYLALATKGGALAVSQFAKPSA